MDERIFLKKINLKVNELKKIKGLSRRELELQESERRARNMSEIKVKAYRVRKRAMSVAVNKE